MLMSMSGTIVVLSCLRPHFWNYDRIALHGKEELRFQM